MSPFRSRHCFTVMSRGVLAILRNTLHVQRKFALTTGLLAVLCVVPPVIATDTPEGITRIEEDWEIQIGTPSPDESAPQITVITTPYLDLSGPYAVFEINDLTLPEFSGGGLQLQSWFQDQNIGLTHHGVTSVLSTIDERITYTMRMSVSDGLLRFQVINGISTTWGNFGGNGSLWPLDVGTTLQNLNTYRPDSSVRLSRCGFAGQLVKSLVLKRVRYYAGEELVKTDEQSRSVETFVKAATP